jgi:hypothetical protein
MTLLPKGTRTVIWLVSERRVTEHLNRESPPAMIFQLKKESVDCWTASNSSLTFTTRRRVHIFAIQISGMLVLAPPSFSKYHSSRLVFIFVAQTYTRARATGRTRNKRARARTHTHTHTHRLGIGRWRSPFPKSSWNSVIYIALALAIREQRMAIHVAVKVNLNVVSMLDYQLGTLLDKNTKALSPSWIQNILM